MDTTYAVGVSDKWGEKMRPIDADALIKELEKDEDKFDKEAEDCRRNSRNYTNDYLCAVMGRADGIRDAIIEIYDAPTIDAVSVVRCGECKHSEPSEDNSLYCKHWDDHFGFFWDEVKSDDFCSYGERKDNGNVD